jgi:hypothetical protein
MRYSFLYLTPYPQIPRRNRKMNEKHVQNAEVVLKWYSL